MGLEPPVAALAQPLPVSGIWGWGQETEGPEVIGERVRPGTSQLDAPLGGVEDFGPNGGKVAATEAGGQK